VVRRSIFTAVAKRPLWRSYIVAYLLVGAGALLLDVGAAPTRNTVVEAIGGLIAFAGLFVFVAALIYSVRFALGLVATPPKSDACSRCGYNLTGNTSGVCPECGTPVLVKPEAVA
jgi:hypothetical protein